MESKIKMNKSVLMLCRTAVLSAVALVLSVFENMIPYMPFVLPGMKLGLSNLAVMFALQTCPLGSVLCIVVIKALFALITRGVTAFFMSLAGGIVSTLVMYIMFRSRKPRFGCMGLGIAGAFAHNCGQLLVAYVIVNNAVYGYFPVLALASVVTGALTGLVYYVIMPHLSRVPLMS